MAHGWLGATSFCPCHAAVASKSQLCRQQLSLWRFHAEHGGRAKVDPPRRVLLGGTGALTRACDHPPLYKSRRPGASWPRLTWAGSQPLQPFAVKCSYTRTLMYFVNTTRNLFHTKPVGVLFGFGTAKGAGRPIDCRRAFRMYHPSYRVTEV